MSSVSPVLSDDLRVSVLDQPRRIIFGVNASEQLPSEIALLSKRDANVFVICDAFLAKTIAFSKMTDSLKQNGMTVRVFDDVYKEPTVDAVDEMIGKISGYRVDCVVGIGGGSSLDRAKFAAVMHPNEGKRTEAYLTLNPTVTNKPLPKILVPTTAGSGSEVSSFAVAIGKDRVKRFLQGQIALADVAIVDPTLTLTCPRTVTAGSGMDVLGTAIEAILSKKATLLSDTLALTAIQLVATHLRQAVNVSSDIRARCHMSLAAVYAGLAVNTPAAANISHCIAEILGPYGGLPHGVAVAIATPYGMDFNLPACKERLVMIARAMGLNVHNLPSDQGAGLAVEAVRQLIKDIGLPSTFSASILAGGKLSQVAEFIVNSQQYAYGLPEINPTPLNLNNVTMLLTRMCS